MSQSVDETIKTREEIGIEITTVMNALNDQYDDSDARDFYNGRLAALRWVLKLEL